MEQAIGRMKCCGILKGTIPISLARLTNHIVYVYAFFTNFGPALVSSPEMSMTWMHILVRFQNVIPKILKLLSITVIVFVNV